MPKKEIRLGNYIVAEDKDPFLIAEIGINHNGDMQIVKKLIDAANSTGWNAVKFQKREPDLAVPEHQKGVMRETPWGKITYLEYKKKVELCKTDYNYIDQYCAEKPIAWTASPWDMPSLEFLLEYDIPFIKIASATITNDDILKMSASSKKPVVLSTGMSTESEIDHAVDILEKYADGNYILMHTNSSYPAKHNELNLNMIKTLKNRYGCVVGYSGHEQDLEPSVVAVTLGARVIERHITLSHEMWGTDQAASLTVPAMGMLSGRIKGIKEMLGNGIKILSDSEMAVRKKLRG